MDLYKQIERKQLKVSDSKSNSKAFEDSHFKKNG